MKRVLVIAEAGVNHNGDIDLARSLVRAAARAGADLVKFQTYRAEDLVVETLEKAAYQQVNTGSSESQVAMLRRLQIDESAHDILVAEAAACGIQFLSTAFDLQSIALLARYHLPYWKVPSGEITDLPYLRAVGSKGGEVLLSTGMADLGEIEDAISALERAGTPRARITVLHCTTEYPTPWGEVNLAAMVSIREAFGVKVGYSDHTMGTDVAVAAVALGATVLEKHFTLSRTLPGPDQAASLEPAELGAMIQSVRHIEEALGDGIKRPTESESRNAPFARKSIVAARAIRRGEPFSLDNLTAKRPGTGISPMLIDMLLGKVAARDYVPDQLVDWQ